MDPDEADRQIARVALLADPVRRSLYRYVARRPGDVGRDEAARAVGVSRALAAFHLDKLAEADLLEVSHRRLSGRTGPGAGRPAKVYRRSGVQLDVTVPRRSYELLATLLARGLRADGGPKGRVTLADAVRRAGEELGSEARRRAGPRPARERLLRAAISVLEENGFEPVRDERGDVRLRNCPFDALAREDPDLVCSVNLWFMEGLLSGLGTDRLSAALDPRPGTCCVVFREAASESRR